MDWADRTEGRGNAGGTADSFFHPSRSSGLGYLIRDCREIGGQAAAPASGSASSPRTTRSPKSPPQPDPQSRDSPPQQAGLAEDLLGPAERYPLARYVPAGLHAARSGRVRGLFCAMGTVLDE